MRNHDVAYCLDCAQARPVGANETGSPTCSVCGRLISHWRVHTLPAAPTKREAEKICTPKVSVERGRELFAAVHQVVDQTQEWRNA